MVFLFVSKVTLGDPCELSWSSEWSTLGPDWLCGVDRAARGGGGCRRGRWGGTCARCTRDSDEKIQIRWRLRILKFSPFTFGLVQKLNYA